MINNPRQLGNELQLKVAQLAEKQARIAELGFQMNNKIWCELTYGSILIQALSALELLSAEQQSEIINMYNNLMNK